MNENDQAELIVEAFTAMRKQRKARLKASRSETYSPYLEDRVVAADSRARLAVARMLEAMKS